MQINIQVVSWWLTTPSHNLSHCQLLISEGLWPSHKSNLTSCAKAPVLYKELEHCTFEFTATSTRGQWVNFSVGVAETLLNLDHGGRIISYDINFSNSRVSVFVNVFWNNWLHNVVEYWVNIITCTSLRNILTLGTAFLLWMFSTLYPVRLYVASSLMIHTACKHITVFIYMQIIWVRTCH